MNQFHLQAGTVIGSRRIGFQLRFRSLIRMHTSELEFLGLRNLGDVERFITHL
jgi:hypothetical protein